MSGKGAWRRNTTEAKAKDDNALPSLLLHVLFDRFKTMVLFNKCSSLSLGGETGESSDKKKKRKKKQQKPKTLPLNKFIILFPGC